MPHVSFVTLSGFRVRESELLALGMTLPGFQDRAHALAELPALGLLTLAGMLPGDWSCSYRAPSAVTGKLISQLADERPQLVAISALTASIEEAYSLSRELRRIGLQTVLGGLHVTALPDEASQQADAAVVGSGESVWLDVLRDAAAGSLQKFYHARREANDVLWPLPRYDLLGPVGRYTLQTQRGCPLACDFCAASRLLGRFREKPDELVRRDLAAICQADPAPLVELADDNTFAGERNAESLLGVMQDSGARWFTEADWRIGERPEIVRQLAAAGCRQVLMGIESMVFRYPGMGGKAAEMQRMTAAAIALQEAGICVNACFIVGADGETPESIERLTEFLLAAPFAEVQVTLQTPFPGTGLHRRLRDQGRLLPERGWASYTLFDVTFQPDLMTVAELERHFQRMLTDVYGTSATRRRQGIRRETWRKNISGTRRSESFARP